MSLSLGRICQLMENNALIGNKDDNLAVEAIKKGLDLRSNVKEGQTFWDDFMRVTGNAKALGHLLGVSEVQVAQWRSKVNQYYRQVMAERKSDEQNKQKRNKMVNTGDNPVARNNNAQGMMANGVNPAGQGLTNVGGNPTQGVR
jgi:hypothetical protein